MKPINLKVGGLNSFREVQEINFSDLCEGGVFGIFGPTGSGKSSILDAITLALYGTVERAANNTQGILNQAEQSVSVQYTFSLGEGERAVVYRAERLYRRSGEKTVKASACRLIELKNEQEKVLASKADEMGKKIEEILGLTVEDFTRAVVLPQGKFAEFLTIKPKDRRQMLERLFSLEAFGRELSSKLLNHLRKTELGLNGVEQRQQGLGDASAQKVKEAETELTEAIEAVTQALEKASLFREKFGEVKEVWALQEQIRESRQKEKELSSRREDVDRISERLSLAECAETVRPMLDKTIQEEQRLKEAEQRTEASLSNLEKARRIQETAYKIWLEQNQKKIEREPFLLRRLEQLEQARVLEEERREKAGSLEKMRSDYENLAKQRKEAEQRCSEVAKQKTLEETKLKNLKQQRVEITVDPSVRSHVQKAAAALDSYLLIVKQAEGIQKDLAQQEEEFRKLKGLLQEEEGIVKQLQDQNENLKQELNNLRQNKPDDEESLGEKAQELERFRALIANIKRAEQEWHEEKNKEISLIKELEKVKKEIERLKTEQEGTLEELERSKLRFEEWGKELKGLQQDNQAAMLGKGLVEGKACPVCGSLQHPNPANVIDDEAVLQLTKRLQEAEIKVKDLEDLKNSCSTQLAVAESGLAVKLAVYQEHVDSLDERFKKIVSFREQLKLTARETTVEQLIEQLAEQEEALTLKRREAKEWHQKEEERLKKLESIQAELSKGLEKKAKVQSLLSEAEGIVKEIRNRIANLLDDEAERKAELDLVRGDTPIEEIAELQKRYRDWDHENVILGQKIIELEKNLQEVSNNHETLSQKRNELDLQLKELETEGREAAQTVQALETKLKRLTDGRQTEELLLESEKELAAVKESEQKSKELYEKRQLELASIERESAVLQKERDLLRESVNTNKVSLAKGLIKAGFQTETEARTALCEDNVRNQMKEEISRFNQEFAVIKEKIADLSVKLGERKVEEEEWVSWPKKLNDTEKLYSDALERRGAVQNALEKLKERHEEWVVLEQERQRLSRLASQLKALQAIFKGNAFVEFMAEEQLMSVAIDASNRLGQLTNGRYALEVDSDGGFIIRDDANGGFRRPVNTLSGGETFLTSLALALALSTQIQLRGESPLEFFFLDEGFGTLDSNLLETVINTLEKLRLQNLNIGIISHVPELRTRLARRLIVTPAEHGGAGSKVSLEKA